MGAKNSKRADPVEFTGPVKIMHDKYGSRATGQHARWVELGFPEKGSFSSNQLEILKVKLGVHEKKNKRQWKPDWNAIGYWELEIERRKGQQTKKTSDKDKKASEKREEVFEKVPEKPVLPPVPQPSKPLYVDLNQLLSIYKVDMDLDCPAQPLPPPYNLPASPEHRPEVASAEAAQVQPSAPVAPTTPKHTSILSFQMSPSRAVANAEQSSSSLPTGDEAAGGGRVLRSHVKKEETLQTPMLECPNPQAGQGGQPPTMLVYCPWKMAEMTSVCESLPDPSEVRAALPEPAGGPLHDLQPGDWVVIKDFRRKKWHQPQWRGPFQILLTMPTAVRVEGRASWIHTSHCKRAPPAPPDEEGDASSHRV